jgi:hypothetical protein
LGDLGCWAWDPARYDWQQTCDAAYRLLYGPRLVAIARTFDAKLSALKDLFHLPPWRFWPVGERSFVGWPCRLKQVEDRPKALVLLDELDVLSSQLCREASRETAIDPTRLETIYLAAIRDTLDYARRMTLLDYPEYTTADLERTMVSLLDSGKLEEGERHLSEVRERLAPQLEQIELELTELKQVDEYVAMWRGQLSGMEYWKQLIVRRRVRMGERFQKLIHGDVASLFPYMEQLDENQLDSLFARLRDPPSGRLLAELQAIDWLQTPPRFQGVFCLGEFESKGSEFVAIAYPRRIPSKPSDTGCVCADIAVPHYTDHLLLDAFVNDTRLENRYPGYRFMQLWANNQLIWEEDIASSRVGKEWISLDISGLVAAGSHLKLRFCVVDKRGVGDHLSVTFLGPVRLRAVTDRLSPSE